MNKNEKRNYINNFRSITKKKRSYKSIIKKLYLIYVSNLNFLSNFLYKFSKKNSIIVFEEKKKSLVKYKKILYDFIYYNYDCNYSNNKKFKNYLIKLYDIVYILNVLYILKKKIINNIILTDLINLKNNKRFVRKKKKINYDVFAAENIYLTQGLKNDNSGFLQTISIFLAWSNNKNINNLEAAAIRYFLQFILLNGKEAEMIRISILSKDELTEINLLQVIKNLNIDHLEELIKQMIDTLNKIFRTDYYDSKIGEYSKYKIRLFYNVLNKTEEKYKNIKFPPQTILYYEFNAENFIIEKLKENKKNEERKEEFIY